MLLKVTGFLRQQVCQNFALAVTPKGKSFVYSVLCFSIYIIIYYFISVSTCQLFDVSVGINAKREVTRGTSRGSGHQPDGITAQVLNDHNAAISTDADYRAPKQTVTLADRRCFTTEMDTFRLLDTLKPTATGLGGIPVWFLRLGRLFSPRRYANSSISH